MPKITHHLTDQILMAYSAGTLPEAFNLVVATHISLCDECRARLHSFDAVGGALIDMSETMEVSADSLEATLRTIAGKPPEPRVARRAAGLFPAPLQAYVGGDIDHVQWRRVGGGVSQAVLQTRGEASVRLLRIPGGVAVPDHGHQGTELTMVLQGAFRDESDRFAAGDIEMADEATVHQPIAEEGEDCICLAATDAPLRFNAFLPRIAQTIMRI